MGKIFRAVKRISTLIKKTPKKDKGKLYKGMLKILWGTEKKGFSFKEREILRKHGKGLWKVISLREYKRLLKAKYKSLGHFPEIQLEKEFRETFPKAQEKAGKFEESRKLEEKLEILDWNIARDLKGLHVTALKNYNEAFFAIRKPLKEALKIRRELIEIINKPQGGALFIADTHQISPKEILNFLNKKIRPLDNKEIHEFIEIEKQYKDRSEKGIDAELNKIYEKESIKKVAKEMEETTVSMANLQWTMNILNYTKKRYNALNDKKIAGLEKALEVMGIKANTLTKIIRSKTEG